MASCNGSISVNIYIFFFWISSIFVGFFKSSRFFVSLCITILLIRSLLDDSFIVRFVSFFVVSRLKHRKHISRPCQMSQHSNRRRLLSPSHTTDCITIQCAQNKHLKKCSCGLFSFSSIHSRRFPAQNSCT